MSQNMNIVLDQKQVPEEEKVESKNLSSHEELQDLENNVLIISTNEEKKDVAKEKHYMSKILFFSWTNHFLSKPCKWEVKNYL